MSKNIYLLGSACYSNIGLTKSKYKDLKTFYSPFHGTRILSSDGILPINIFFNDIEEFKRLYFDKCNWFLKNDGDDIQAYNVKLNLRKCHLHEGDEFVFIDRVKGNLENFNVEKYIFILDLTDYCVFNLEQAQIIKFICEKHKIMPVMRIGNVEYGINDIYRHFNCNQKNDYNKTKDYFIKNMNNIQIINSYDDFVGFFNNGFEQLRSLC